MKKAIQYVLYTFALLYFPCILILPIFTDQSGSFFVFNYWFLLLIYFLLTFHFFCAFLEIGFTLLRAFEKKERKLGEKILNTSSILLAVAILLIALVDPEREFNILAMVLSGVLIILWIIGDVVYKQRKFTPDTFKKKSLWISVISVFVTACIILAVTTGKFGSKNEVDTEVPVEGYFVAEVVEVSNETLIVKPNKKYSEARSSDKISVPNWFYPDYDIKKGVAVAIYYDGAIMETYPATLSGIYKMSVTYDDGSLYFVEAND